MLKQPTISSQKQDDHTKNKEQKRSKLKMYPITRYNWNLMLEMSKDGEYFINSHHDKKREVVMAICCSKNARYIVKASFESGIYIFDLSTGRVVIIKQEKRPSDNFVTSMVYSPNENFIVIGNSDKKVRIYESKTGQIFKVLDGHTKGVSSVCSAPDGFFFASASYDGSIIIWNMASYTQTSIFKEDSYLRSIDYSSNGRLIVSGSNKGTKLYTWKQLTFVGITQNISCVKFSPRGKIIASGSYDQIIRIRSYNGKLIARLAQHHGHVSCIDFSADGNCIVSGSQDGSIRLHYISTRSHQIIKGHKNGMRITQFSPDGRYIISGGHDRMMIQSISKYF